MKFTTRELTEYEVERLSRIIDLDLCENICKYNGFIAGGAVVYVLNHHLYMEQIGDIDIFLPEGIHSTECAQLVSNYFGDDTVYYRQPSTLKFMSQSKNIKPIQIINTPGVEIETTLESFDFDYVMCAIYKRNNTFYTTMSEWTEFAHKTGTIRIILDYPYNPVRLWTRLQKACAKGFTLPTTYKLLNDIPIKFYVPKKGNSNQKLPPIPRYTEDYYIKNYKPNNMEKYTSLDEALESPFTQFYRHNYDGEEPYEDAPHMRYNECCSIPGSNVIVKFIYLAADSNDAENELVKYKTQQENIKIVTPVNE